MKFWWPAIASIKNNQMNVVFNGLGRTDQGMDINGLPVAIIQRSERQKSAGQAFITSPVLGGPDFATKGLLSLMQNNESSP